MPNNGNRKIPPRQVDNISLDALIFTAAGKAGNEHRKFNFSCEVHKDVIGRLIIINPSLKPIGIIE